MNIALTKQETARVAKLAEQRPGISRHRTGKAIFRLGERVLVQQPEALDDELACMSREDEQRRKPKGSDPTIEEAKP